ncbi:MAG: EI24 domain-containing protein [Burkholderiales bacterium]
MTEITRALARAVASLAQPKMLFLMIWPIALALIVWAVLAILFGAQTVVWLQGYLTGSAVGAWASRWFPFDVIAAVLSWVALFVMFVPLVLVTATLIIAVVAMPTMVNHVAATYYPTLERRRGGTFAGSAWNAVVALAVFLVFSLLLLPLWFVPLFWPVLPVLLFAYFNQRVFRYDAVAEHASAGEMRELFRRHGKSLYGLGIVLSLLAHIPVIGFFIPVVAGLAFTHYLLERVAELRRTPVVVAR